MAKQIEDILPCFLHLSVDEQERIVETCRYHKYVSRPSHQAKKRAAVKRKTKSVSTKVKNLVKGMSQDEITRMLTALGGKA